MKLDGKNLEEENVSGDISSLEAGISQENLGIIFDMVSTQMYKNPIESIVREITSNCFDSHIEAGIDDPVIIELGNDEEGDFISFTDVGVGLSPDRIQKVYMNYFSSTKRDTNEQIGGFGLGSKSPLAYADMFYINTVFDKVKYQYILHKGAQKPALDKLGESETEERNGTEIRIYIKESDPWDSDSDLNKFSQAIRKQLLYFDNVYIKITNNALWLRKRALTNDWKILEFETFKFRTDVYGGEDDHVTNRMHICYGKVNYPIDWDEIKMAPIYTPVGIKFDIGDLMVTPNRESLRYTDEIKSKIIAKIKEVSNELRTLFYAQNRDINSLQEYFLRMNEKPCISIPDVDYPDTIYRIYVKNIKDVKTEYVFKPLQDIGAVAVGGIINSEEWSISGGLHNGKKTHTGDYREVSEIVINGKKAVILKESPNSFYRNRYIGSCNFLRKWVLTPRQIYYKYLPFVGAEKMVGGFGSGSHAEVGIAKKIYLYRKIVEAELYKMFPVYEDIVVPKEFISENMPKRASTKELRMAQKMIRIFDFNKDTWVDEKPVDILSHTQNRKGKSGGLLVYGFRENKDMLEKAYLLLRQKENLRNDFSTIEEARREYRVYLRKFTDDNGVIRFDQMTNAQVDKAVSMKVRIEKLKKDFKNRRKTISGLNNKAARVIMIAKKDEHTLPPSSTVTHVGNLFSDNQIFREIATAALIEDFDFLPNYSRYDGSSSYQSNFPEKFSEINNRIANVVAFLEEYTRRRTFVNASTKRYRAADVRIEILNIATKANLFDPNILELVEEVRKYFEGADMLKYVYITASNKADIAKYLKDQGKAININFYTKGIIDSDGRVLEEGSEAKLSPAGDVEVAAEAVQLLDKQIVPFSFYNPKVA